MDNLKYFQKLANIKHVVVATKALDTPDVAFLDVMDVDATGIYFMTSQNGRNLYSMLNNNSEVSIIAKSEGDFFHSQMLQIKGKIKNIGKDKVAELLDKNDYLKKIYPDSDSEKRKIIDVFKVDSGDFFYQDFSKNPAQHIHFKF